MIQPLHDHVLIRPDRVEERTPGGLYKPDTIMSREKFKQMWGTVVRLGPGAFADESKAPGEGDRVMFEKGAGREVEENGINLLLLTQDDILAMEMAA